MYKTLVYTLVNKFRYHGNGGRSGKNAVGSIRWPIPEKPL